MTTPYEKGESMSFDAFNEKFIKEHALDRKL